MGTIPFGRAVHGVVIVSKPRLMTPAFRKFRLTGGNVAESELMMALPPGEAARVSSVEVPRPVSSREGNSSVLVSRSGTARRYVATPKSSKMKAPSTKFPSDAAIVTLFDLSANPAKLIQIGELFFRGVEGARCSGYGVGTLRV